eukprot:363211-Chlamydomonas_euryale.AAC.17
MSPCVRLSGRGGRDSIFSRSMSRSANACKVVGCVCVGEHGGITAGARCRAVARGERELNRRHQVSLLALKAH